ncbi:uncharacterized protein LOC124160463 [Ischnura elegans]|uniref:uncharacterized protein LOC124160463 n=1 Tax=Ischnura elegans TaxID=197161 RepID=UPI001ED8AFBF|nr:uncharacterized protein LOC124160463 [Ischnura elegans]
MEVMEEGNLMDRVQILLQRDLAYYEEHQKVLQERLCSEVVGGQLDFPHHASFASVKLVSWWEGEFVAAFHKPSDFLPTVAEKSGAGTSDDEAEAAVVITSVPEEFARLTESSAAQLLEHLHTLSQEALDHADLTVLTGTLGAAALTRNALWCYNELLKRSSDTSGLSLHNSFKQFNEMVEALAERLLDLHNRLLSLYILQDADSLNWEHNQAFFEGQRGSFIIQMWWLYMQGTREDLWNTVPPKTAQRVFAGMLNESLTILTVRYSQATPSMSRGNLVVIDISNLLLCVRHLLPAICTNKAELIGLSNQNKVVRDIHSKCHELLCCLITRGCPLAILYKHFRKPGDPVPIFSERPVTPAPWYMVVSSHCFTSLPKDKYTTKDLPDKTAVALDLTVLMAQPEASWPLLLKVLMMRKSLLSSLLFHHLIHTNPAKEEKSLRKEAPATAEEKSNAKTCLGFLCAGNCRMKGKDRIEEPMTQTACAVIHIAAMVGCIGDLGAVLQPVLECPTSEIKTLWGCCDGRQVWDEHGHPAWFKALTRIMAPSLEPAVKNALQNKCSIKVLLHGVAQLAECLPTTLYGASQLLEDALPADVRPLGGSVLMQMVGAALYSVMMDLGKDEATAMAEALCNMDKRKYHSQIKEIKHAFATCFEEMGDKGDAFSTVEEVPYIADIYVSHLLLTESGKQALKTIYKFLQHNMKWILGQLGALDPNEVVPPMRTPKLKPPDPPKLLHSMFNIGAHKFDELLTGTWNLDWKGLLQTPLSLTPKKMWTQLTYRPEFREPQYLNEHDKKVVETISKYFSHHHAQIS